MLQIPHHNRTVTRFCDEAGLANDDQVDLAEFIVAARYMGTEASDEQLMRTFLDFESAHAADKASAKAQLKQLLSQVDAENGQQDEHKTDDVDNDEVLPIMGHIEEDAEWQEIQLDTFISDAGEDGRFMIAKNLMLTTSLSPQQVADITGVDVDKLAELDSGSEYESDDDDYDESVTDTVTASGRPQLENSVSIQATEFNRAVMLSATELAALDACLQGGADAIKENPDDVLMLLRKFKAAFTLTPEGQKKSKQLKKMHQRTETANNGGNVPDRVPTFPRKYRVVISPGALIKENEEVQSAQVAKLPIGSVVTVAEIRGRRARLIEPVHGWCSTSSKDGRIILQPEKTNSPEMQKAVHAARSRQTKVLILKSITTLEDTTVKRILEKSDWNLRRAIEAFYIAKYKTAEYLKTQAPANGGDEIEVSGDEREPSDDESNVGSTSGTGGGGGTSSGSKKKKHKKGWWGKWKKFVHANQ